MNFISFEFSFYTSQQNAIIVLEQNSFISLIDYTAKNYDLIIDIILFYK